MVGFKKTLFVAVVALVLAACSDPAEQILTEYPTRLERVLEVDPEGEHQLAYENGGKIKPDQH